MGFDDQKQMKEANQTKTPRASLSVPVTFGALRGSSIGFGIFGFVLCVLGGGLGYYIVKSREPKVVSEAHLESIMKHYRTPIVPPTVAEARKKQEERRASWYSFKD